MTSLAGQANQAEVERLLDRIDRLTRAIDGASGERDLAMYLAIQAGAAITDVARVAILDPAEARSIIDQIAADPADTHHEGPEYRAFWPHRPTHIGNG